MSPEPAANKTLIGIDATAPAEQDEDVPTKDRPGDLRRLNKKVVEVTEAAAEATAEALEAAEAARQARKRKRAKATTQARKRKRDAAVRLGKSAASGALKAVRPDQNLDLATELNLPPQREASPPVRERRQNVVSLRLDNAEFERIKQFASHSGLPVSTSVRALLMQALDRDDQDQRR